MKTLLSLIVLAILTSSCVRNTDCKAKPDAKVTIDQDIHIEVTPGASVSCSF